MHVHHVAILAHDVARVAAFYAEVLGLEAVAPPRSGVAWFRVGGTLLMIEPSSAGVAMASDSLDQTRERIGARGHPGGETGLQVLALGIAPNTRASWRERLRAKGVEVTNETPFTLYVRDPEGNRVGLSHWPDPAPE